jgi:predicted amidohydrolase YtcJ
MCLSSFEQELPMDDYKGAGKLKVGGVKLMLDGALGSWGASMIDPYDGMYSVPYFGGLYCCIR